MVRARRPMRNHNRLYTLLNVLPDADPVVIEAAYKALMKRYHPDIASGGAAAGRAAELNQAYRILRDPQRRAAYDAEERARQERHRAELAQAMSASSRPPAPPPPRQPPLRVGQRAASWVALAGILLLAGALTLLARGSEDPRPAQVPQPDASGARSPAALREAAAAFRDQPVDRSEVEEAVGEFRRITGAGSGGIAAYSEHCFDVHSRTLAADDFDHCVAFDHVASRVDLRPGAADEGSRPEPRFQPQNLVPRHIRAAERVGADPGLIEARLFEVRRLADNAVNRAAAEQLGIVTATPAPAAAAPLARAATRAVPRQLPPARARPSPPKRQAQAEQDFLEREGGIY